MKVSIYLIDPYFEYIEAPKEKVSKTKENVNKLILKSRNEFFDLVFKYKEIKIVNKRTDKDLIIDLDIKDDFEAEMFIIFRKCSLVDIIDIDYVASKKV